MIEAIWTDSLNQWQIHLLEDKTKYAWAGEKKVTFCNMFVLSPSGLPEGEKQRWHSQTSYVKNNHIHIWQSLSSGVLDNWKYQIWWWQ